MKYEVIPQNGRKSFYGKAIVTEENGIRTLTSYTTDVARIDTKGRFTRLWDGYSVTTMNHVNSFRIMCGLEPISKREWLMIQVEDDNTRNHTNMTPQQSLKAMYLRRKAG